MLKILRDYTCPVCGSTQHEILFARDFRSLRQIVPFEGYDICCCKICGMVYAGNIAEGVPTEEYYQIMSKYETRRYVTETIMTRYNWVTDFMRKYLDTSKSVLEIGCASGEQLYSMKKAGFQQLCGIDASRVNVNYAAEQYGLETHVGYLGSSIPAIAGRKFDVLILEAILEHILPLRSAIADAVDYLKDDGYCFVIVPDLGSFPEEDNLYQEFSIEHINYWLFGSLHG